MFKGDETQVSCGVYKQATITNSKQYYYAEYIPILRKITIFVLILNHYDINEIIKAVEI